ncbi:MAG: DUF4102 domain-containing protein [Planctomycetota bacterium]|nr:MAG: DUF4102 domain-containing protein [Planctomycetota bacterium]REK29711.1 MAG: DUF4102 domain-containing protein [Planctomycetota bacterium]REK30468.1 MAG: DUF4102 domain-containing protein [Planctomycetota bacterium]
MPTRLSNAVVKRLKAGEKRFAVSDDTVAGLRLEITPAGVRTFYYRGTVNGQRQRVRIGRWPEITVEKARQIARKHAGAVAEGKNLPTAGRSGKGTLGALFDHYLQVHAKQHKRTWERDEREFERWFGRWKGRTLSSISKADVTKRISQVADAHGKAQANKARALLSKMFNVAIESDLIEKNPVLGTRRFELSPRQRYLKPEEVKAFFQAIAKLQNETARHYFLMLLATGQRRTAVAGMRWGELDIDGRLWTIPASRSKSKKPVGVPLSNFAVDILEARQNARNGSPFVFPGRGKHGHYSEPKEALRRIREWSGIPDVTIHDLRRTIGSWASQGGLSLRTVQLMLAHSDPRITADHYSVHETSQTRDALDATVERILEKAGDDRPTLRIADAG